MSTRKCGGAKPPQADATKIAVPEMPPLTEAERRFKAKLCSKIEALTRICRQKNLNNAVLLAQQAARHQGPLVDHFAELGRRFANDLLRTPPEPDLRVIDGGKQ